MVFFHVWHLLSWVEIARIATKAATNKYPRCAIFWVRPFVCLVSLRSTRNSIQNEIDVRFYLNYQQVKIFDFSIAVFDLDCTVKRIICYVEPTLYAIGEREPQQWMRLLLYAVEGSSRRYMRCVPHTMMSWYGCRCKRNRPSNTLWNMLAKLHRNIRNSRNSIQLFEAWPLHTWVDNLKRSTCILLNTDCVTNADLDFTGRTRWKRMN